MNEKWSHLPVDLIQPDGTVEHMNLKEAAENHPIYGKEITASLHRVVADLSEDEINKLISGMRSPSVGMDLSRGVILETPDKPFAIDVRHDDLAKAQIAQLDSLLSLLALECKLAPPLTADERERLLKQIERVCGELAVLHPDSGRKQDTGTQPADWPPKMNIEKVNRAIRAVMVRQSASERWGLIPRPLDDKTLDNLIQGLRENASKIKSTEDSIPSATAADLANLAMAKGRVANLVMAAFIRYPSSLTSEQLRKLRDHRKACDWAAEQVLILQKKHDCLPESGNKSTPPTTHPAR